MIRRAITWLALTPMLIGCQTVPVGRASVNLDEPKTRAVVISVLAKAVHRAHIELGPTGPDTNVITVLPPPVGPLEMNSTAMPIRFDIERADDHCRAVRQDTQEAFDLPGVSCGSTGA